MKTENKFVKVGAVSPRIRLADVAGNVKLCIAEAKRAADMGVKLLVFPKYTFTGATCRDLFYYEILSERVERGLADFIKETAQLDMVSVISLSNKTLGDALAVTYLGKLVCLVKLYSSYSERDDYCERDLEGVKIAGMKTEIHFDGTFVLPFNKKIAVGVAEQYDDYTTDPEILIASEAKETIIGTRAENLEHAKHISNLSCAAYIVADAGVGESTTDAVYSANNIISYRGDILAEALPFAEDTLITADVDLEKSNADNAPCTTEATPSLKTPSIKPRQDFFLPVGKEEQRIACLEALEIQSHALAARIERSYSRAMVIGVSGGLDSTLALLVCARAADILGMDRKSIIGVTMPCFGTTKRTKSNAERLCEALGTTLRVVDIKASVTQHLADIGHDGVTPDVTYENAQARERTQVIMDISNMTGGLVVGTGDLSELALGWATYNGDHMSMYAVNASVPKTMVRRITEVYSDEHRGEGEVSAILDDILATPVSPELLPPKDGEISQCTEALVGPYELHDYFLYHMLYRKMSPRKIYENAKFDFCGVYDNETIFGWLRVFVRRFFSQQFKRSCLPDGPKVSCVSVSPRCGLSMPSDASAAVWLEELDEIEKEEK